MARHLSPWPEQRPTRTEAERSAFAKEQSAHLPYGAGPFHVSDDDLAAMKAAHANRFNEQTPRTETLMAVAHIGYRMALRDLLGWRENDWPEGFDRRTAEIMAQRFAGNS